MIIKAIKYPLTNRDILIDNLKRAKNAANILRPEQ